MQTTYTTTIIREGNHASFEIPEEHLAAIGGNRRAPLKITINGHTYQSTATGVDGKCMVVFPTRDREAAAVSDEDDVTVTLELDDGYRQVELPDQLAAALHENNLDQKFRELSYYERKTFARLVAEAKADETRDRRIKKIIETIRGSA